MMCGARLRLLGALIFLVSGFATGAAAKDKAPPCSYSEQPLAAGEAAAKSSRLLLADTMPAAGEAVHPNTVIGIDVEYHVANFAPGRYRLVINFAGFVPGATTTVDDSYEDRFITQADGKAHLCATIRGLFTKEDVRWPLQMFVSLEEHKAANSGILHAETRRVDFPSPELSSKALERQKLALPEDYFHALEAIFMFHEENAAAYRACVARLPDTAATLDAPYRDWNERNHALFEQLDALQLERFTLVFRGSDAVPAQELKKSREEFDAFMERQSDVALRGRCAKLRLVLTGDPAEFVGRYLHIVNEHVASRAAGKPAAR